MGSWVITVSRACRRSLVIVGFPGSGKSSTAHLLGKRNFVPVLEMGKIVEGEARESGQNAQEFAELIFRMGAYTHFAEKLIALPSARPPLLVVGPRRPEELSYLTSHLRPCVSVGLVADEWTRRARQCSDLGLDPEPKMIERLASRDEVERGWGLDVALKLVDVELDSSVPMDVLVEEVERFWRTADEVTG